MKQIGFCLSALLFVSPLLAQDVLDPLVVTGKREVGEAVEGNVNVDQIQAERVNELLGFVPGLASIASDSAGYGDILAVRGTGNTLFFGPAGVGMVVDDVPFGDVFGYSTEFFDLDFFTLHRGPQGSRFGRNAAGGMMEMRTAGPTKDPLFKLSAEYGSYDLLNLRLRASGAINDRWSYAVQSYYKKRNGYIENVNPAVGGYSDTREQFGALGSLYYNPSADMQVRFRAMIETTRDGSQRLTALPGVASNFGPFVDSFRAQDSFRVASDLEGETELDRYQLSLHLDQDFGWAKLKSITSYQKWQLGPNTVDLDLTPLGATTSSIAHEQQLWSQEFRLESDETQDVRWATGLAYLRKDNDGLANRFFGTGPTSFENQFTTFSVVEESAALYGHVEWDTSPALTFNVGGRLEYVDSAISRSKTGAGFPFPSGLPIPAPFRGESEGWYFSPSIGANYAINEQVSLFARTSLAFKPEGFTGYSDDPSTTAFDEEQSWESEVGVRYQNADQSLGLELRGFYKQIDDYQLNRSTGFTDFVIVNADRVEALGLEGEMVWKPTDQFTVQATAGVSQIEFDNHTGGGGQDLSGNDVPFLPEFTASLGLRYDFASGFFAQTSVRAVGATYYDEVNNSDFKQGSYQVWDAQLGYEAENWSAVVFARNLFDEEYYTFLNNTIAAGSPGDPEVFGVRVGVEF
jgi:iron complex outermembrane receptor protein